MRAKPQFHERLGFRQARGIEPIGLLITLHRIARCSIPPARRRLLQIPCVSERLLNLFDPLRLQAKSCQVMVRTVMMVRVMNGVARSDVVANVMMNGMVSVVALHRLVRRLHLSTYCVLPGRMWFVPLARVQPHGW